MKRAMAIGLLLALALAAPALASQTKPAAKPEPGWAEGTITAWDEASKTFKMKGDDGQETDLIWDGKTKVHGTAKVGEPAKVKHKKDKDGKLVATHIYVGKAEIEKAKN